MATPTIPNGEEYFFNTLYEGNGKGQRVGKFVPFTDNGTIANSCLFENNVSSYLSRTLSSNGSGTTVTFSCWVKRDILTQGLIGSVIMMHSNVSTNSEILEFNSTDNLHYYEVTSGTRKWNFATVRTFEDTTKWYHIMVARNTTEDSPDDRVKIYVDGELLTDSDFQDGSGALDLIKPAKNDTGYWNQTTYDAVVGNTNNGSYIDGAGYLAEVNMVDGTALTPDTFGVTDTSTGRWIPKTLSGITYGTNGFRLTFQNNDAVANLGYDYQTSDRSGTTNDFSVTNLATTNQTTDSPTQNFATLQGTGGTLSEGNLKLVTGNTERAHHNATLKPKSGKYYAEFTCNAMGRSEVGVVSTLNVPYSSSATRLPATSDESVAGYMYYGYNGRVYYDSSNKYDVTYATYTTNDLISIALDLDNHTVEFFKTTYDSVSASYGSRVSQGTLGLPNSNYIFAVGDGAAGYGGGWTANFGQRSFIHTPPTGFVALQQDKLPSTAKGISGLVWTKNRDASDDHQWYDSSRGAQQVIESNTTSAEATVADGLQKFLAGGQQIEDDVSINTNGESYVSWNWVANGGTTENIDVGGDITIASVVQKNTTAGFSIVQYTGNGSASQKIGHGLSQAPEFIVTKRLDGTQSWHLYHSSQGPTKYALLDSTGTFQSSTLPWQDTSPDATWFSVGSGNTNQNTQTYVAYCWHGVDGFSKIGKYRGNSSSTGDGPFVFLGFKPAWVLIKNVGDASQWRLFDGARNTFNPVNKSFRANATNTDHTDNTYYLMDFLSNGFKIRGQASTDLNSSSYDYAFLAFAEHPFLGDGTSPMTAG
tara:strand:- start:6561 stop:9008 length:2448 start_codon:yes stop_codon:yes gene_type:complete